MISVAVVSALALLSGARASEHQVVNQLETARTTQAAQRVEFGVDGDMTPFRFTFKDSVNVRFFRSCKPTILHPFVAVTHANPSTRALALHHTLP
jgi:hypothetical protein